MNTSIRGRLRVWEDGSAVVTTENRELRVVDATVAESLITGVLATSAGEIVFDHPCEVFGKEESGEVRDIELLIMQTDTIDFYVKGEAHKTSG